MNEIKINKQAKSITFIKNGIAFSQFGIAKEILDLVDNQQQEIDRLNNIINDLEKRLTEEYDYCDKHIHPAFGTGMGVAKRTLDKLKELKENK